MSLSLVESRQNKAISSVPFLFLQDAKESARKSLSLWLPKFEAVRQNKADTAIAIKEEEEGAAAAEAQAVDPVEASLDNNAVT